MVREMLPGDNDSVLEIYRMGLETRNATFETTVPTWNEWDSKHLPHSRFVSVENEKLNHKGSQSTSQRNTKEEININNIFNSPTEKTQNHRALIIEY